MDTVERTEAPVEQVYDGLISYSHAADGLLAPGLQVPTRWVAERCATLRTGDQPPESPYFSGISGPVAQSVRAGDS